MIKISLIQSHSCDSGDCDSQEAGRGGAISLNGRAARELRYHIIQLLNGITVVSSNYSGNEHITGKIEITIKRKT